MSQRRTFASLRQPAEPATPAGKEESIEDVCRRLFHTSPDGRRLLAWLEAETAEPTPLNCSEAHLRDAEGARRLVARLRLMAKATVR